MSFCPRCGRQLGIPPFYGQTLGQRPQQRRQSSENRFIFLVIALVAILVVLPIVLSAVLYFMVLGFGSDSGSTPSSALTPQEIVGGEMFTFSALTRDVVWSDVTVVLSDGINTVAWSPSTTDLDNGSSVTAPYPSALLGGLTVSCSVTDLAGNGRIDHGDLFTLATGSGQSFSTAVDYIVTLIYDPTNGEICSASF